MKRVLICGDRGWTNGRLILKYLKYLQAFGGTKVVIEGECSGADSLARKAAEELGLEVAPFPANWKKFGRAAGPIRNQQMLDEGKPTYVLAFHNDIEHSKGTKDMVARARKAHIPVREVKEKDR